MNGHSNQMLYVTYLSHTILRQYIFRKNTGLTGQSTELDINRILLTSYVTGPAGEAKHTSIFLPL